MQIFFGYSLPAPPFPPGAPDCVPASPCRKAGAGAMSACGNRFSSAPAGRPRCPATSPPCFARHIIPRIAPYEKNFLREIPPVLRPPSCLRHQRGHFRLPCRRSPVVQQTKNSLAAAKNHCCPNLRAPFLPAPYDQKLCCLPARSNTFFYPPCPADIPPYNKC